MSLRYRGPYHYSHHVDIHITRRSSIITNALEYEVLPELFAYLIIVCCLSYTSGRQTCMLVTDIRHITTLSIENINL